MDHTLHCHLNVSIIIFYLLYISNNVKKKEYYCSNVKLELTAKAIKTLYPQIFCILIRSQKILSQVRVMPFISAVNFGVRLTEIDINLKRQRNHHIEMNSFYSLLSQLYPLVTIKNAYVVSFMHSVSC